MKQITEDYCSFEISKLLKEKVFPQDYDKYHGLVYNEEGYEDEYEIQRMVLETRQVKAGTLHSYPLGVPEPKCYCPTQSLALKWLREVHNIVIEINMEDYMTSKNGELQVWYSYTIWTFIRHLGETGLTDARYDDRAFWQENVKVGQSYEEAVEAALKYTLENLI